MELRLIVAYSIIAFLLVAGSAAGIVYRRRSIARRRRLRGIKT
ncbi:hypothetical protein [Sphingomonas aracearum]|nr:hypothetical protein [Sphingomonas aracearum]